ncbi:MAG: hypothetical protein IJ546_08175 [Prevotella sp.]|nr:hypothetical protein [Prevotella sp.]
MMRLMSFLMLHNRCKDTIFRQKRRIIGGKLHLFQSFLLTLHAYKKKKDEKTIIYTFGFDISPGCFCSGFLWYDPCFACQSAAPGFCGDRGTEGCCTRQEENKKDEKEKEKKQAEGNAFKDCENRHT